jgi:hypothetical protein
MHFSTWFQVGELLGMHNEESHSPGQSIFSAKKDLRQIFAWHSLNNQNECSNFATFLSLFTVPNGTDDTDELSICESVIEVSDKIP